MINTRVYEPGVGTVPVTVGVGTTVLIRPWSFCLYDDYRSGMEAVYFDGTDWKVSSTEGKLDATVDATDEIKALYAKKLADDAQAKRDAEAKASAAAERAKLKKVDETYSPISRGDFVTVTKGRKVPKGTVGKVIWIGDGKWGARVGLIDAAGVKHWTALVNVTKTSVPAESVRRAVVEAATEDRAEWIAKRQQAPA